MGFGILISFLKLQVSVYFWYQIKYCFPEDMNGYKLICFILQYRKKCHVLLCLTRSMAEVLKITTCYTQYQYIRNVRAHVF